MKSLREVDAAGLCIGCGLCAGAGGGQVRLEAGADGFDHPVVEELTPGLEAELTACCPGAGVRQPARAATPLERLWGPLAGSWTGHATDAATRHAGSSGGALSALAIHLLESGRVDAVLQVRADEGRPLENRAVLSRTAADVLACAGSRYAPAAVLAGLEAALAEADRLAVIGRPCDIAALRAWLARRPHLAARVPWLLSFFCAGTPGRRGTAALLERLGVAPDEVLRLRYRGEGWPGDTVAETAAGARRLSYQESWGEVLNRHLHLRCKLCPDGSGGLADVACGDAWEEEGGYPAFRDAPGRSLVLARTAAGAALLAEARAAGRLELEPYDPAGLQRIQPFQARRRRALAARLAALRLSGRPAPVYRGFHLLRLALAAGPRLALSEAAGMWRRRPR